MKIPEHPIFLKSVEYIRSQIDCSGLNKVQQSILERIVHSSGDLTLKPLLTFSPGACEVAIDALNKGAMILTDTYMAHAAISSVAQKTLNSNVKCILDMAPKSINDISETKSAMAMRATWLDVEEKQESLKAPIVVIGSAPTALMMLLDLIEQGSRKPSLIIGMPVGFIGVPESKKRLLKSYCSNIVLEGTRGGASIAAATINALLRAAE